MDRKRLLRRIALGLAALAAAVVCIYASPRWLNGSASFEISERYEFTSERDAKVALAVMTPRTGPYQRVQRTMVSWEGSVERNVHGKVDVHYIEGPIRAGERKDAILTFGVTLLSGPVDWYSPVMPADLSEEPDIQSDHPEVRGAASRLDGARHTCEFVHFHVGQKKNEDTRRSALEALRTGMGSYPERADLMTALCRAEGVPARRVTGLSFRSLAQFPFWRTPETPSHPMSAHAWVEFHDGARWQLADPTLHTSWWPNFGPSDGQRLSFGDTSDKRRLHEDIEAWAASFGHSVSARRGPFQYASGATEPGVSVRPYATVVKLGDTAWTFALLGVILAGLLAFAADRILEHGPGFLLERLGDLAYRFKR